MSDEAAKLPWYLKYANKVLKLLGRFGFVPGPVRVLAVPGRRTGKLRATPVSPLEVGGKRYVVAGIKNSDWASNARAAGWGVLKTGKESERVTLVELPVEERGPVLREFPIKVKGGVEFFTKLYGVSADPDDFATLADRCPVFRIDPSTGGRR